MAVDRHSLRLAIVSPTTSIDTSGSVFLEQEAWDPYVGQLSKLAAAQWLLVLLFQATMPEEYCPSADPGYSKVVYAYPSDPYLNYTAGCSNGVLGGRIVEFKEFTELVACNLELTPDLSYPPFSIQGYTWEGDVYTAAGELRSMPAVSIIDGRLTLAEKVYGSLRVTYIVCRHAYELIITPRTEYTENKYQSFFYAVWDGGNTMIEVEAPAGYDEDETTCNNKLGDGLGSFGDTTINGGGEGSGEDEGPYGPVSGSDDTVGVDYCTQEII